MEFTSTHTMGVPEMLTAMIEANDATGESYALTLGRSDMRVLMTALATAAGYIDWHQHVSEETRSEAVSLFAGIGETLGVQGI